MKVTDFLSRGAHSARTTKELQSVLHLTVRDIRELVRTARLQGVFVCSRTRTDESGKAGFFLPECLDDELKTIRQLKNREKEIRRVRLALEKNLVEKYGA